MTGLLTPATPTPSASALAALTAAFCWTVATLLWRGLPGALTANQLNLCKTLLAFLLQLPLLALVRWPDGQGGALLLLALSGVVGIAWGDSFFFSALRRLGSRRCLTLTAGGPALSALVGLVTLGEQPRAAQWLGIGLISLSVVLVARQAPPDPGRGPTSTEGVPWAGLALALAAMACGTAGALLARGALRSGEVPALLAASVRLGGGTLALAPVLIAIGREPMLGLSAARRWPTVVAATLLGTSAGILLQQMALIGLPGGLAVALLSTSPVMALPFAGLEGDRPGRLGLLAALAATAGVSLVAGFPLPAPLSPGKG